MSDDEREKYPSEEAERFQVRMPPGMRDRIKDAAARANRSMNAEIIATLEEKYPEPVSVGLTLKQIFDEIIAPLAYVEDPKERDRKLRQANERLEIESPGVRIKYWVDENGKDRFDIGYQPDLFDEFDFEEMLAAYPAAIIDGDDK